MEARRGLVRQQQQTRGARAPAWGYARASGALLLVAGIIFLITNTIAEGVYPGYSVMSNPLSDLGAIGAPTMLLWNGQLLVVGLLGALGMYLLFFKSGALCFRPRVGVLYILPNLGMVVVALFPENSVAPWLHLLGALDVFLFGGASVLFSYRFTGPPFRYFSLFLGAMSLACIPLLGAPSLIGFGLAERLVLYPVTLWLTAFGGYVMSLGSQ